MNLQRLLPKIHLYLGCFFAPMIMLFSATGFAMVFEWHKRMKDSAYQPPAWLETLTDLHRYQGLRNEWDVLSSSLVFKIMAAGMAFGLLAVTLIGIYLAIQRTPRKQRWIPLIMTALGIIIPTTIIAVSSMSGE